LGGRSFRGRNYLGGIPSTVLADPNNVTVEAADAIKSAYDNLRDTDLVAVQMAQVVYSQFTNGAPRTTGLASEVVEVIVTSRLDTQRRRMKGSGL
jgi:hypothetical protein